MMDDYMRVYDGVKFNRKGKQIPASADYKKNFLNHQKVYKFAAQFVEGKTVGDLGCGSGHGSELLLEKAKRVYGSDVSDHAIAFAKRKYNADFSVQDITNLTEYKDKQFDVTVCSEVLEHIKGSENQALEEMKRVTNGILVIGTPNSELLGNHGFYYHEIDSLMSRHFKNYVIFENAIIPKEGDAWGKRVEKGQTGVIISQDINLDETVLNHGSQVKQGIPASYYQFRDLTIDTTLLHNTHSWMVVAIK